MERGSIGDRVRDLDLQLKDDGIHAGGYWIIPIFPDIRFNTVMDLVWVSPDNFEPRVRKIDVLFLDLSLSDISTRKKVLVLKAARKR